MKLVILDKNFQFFLCVYLNMSQVRCLSVVKRSWWGFVLILWLTCWKKILIISYQATWEVDSPVDFAGSHVFLILLHNTKFKFNHAQKIKIYLQNMFSLSNFFRQFMLLCNLKALWLLPVSNKFYLFLKNLMNSWRYFQRIHWTVGYWGFQFFLFLT